MRLSQLKIIILLPAPTPNLSCSKRSLLNRDEFFFALKFHRGGKIEIMRSPEHKVTLIHEKLTIDINSLKTYLHRIL